MWIGCGRGNDKMKTIKELEKEIEEFRIKETGELTLSGQFLEYQKQTLKDVLKLIDELKTPYPIDVFPGITEEGKLARFGHQVRENLKRELKEEIEGE